MADILLLDWDDAEVRVLHASESGGDIRVREAKSAPLEGEVSAAAIATALKPLVDDKRHSRSRVIACVGGRDIQSRLLRIPSVPDDELPELVRFRAGTDFPLVESPTVIDYLPLARGTDGPIAVLAARVTDKTLGVAREVCTKLDLAPHRITMRGCGIARLAARYAEHTGSGVHVVVAQRSGEIDLVGTLDGGAAVVRTVQLPANADADVKVRSVSRELRRTLAAVSTELGVGAVESVQWIIGSDHDREIAERVGSELSRRIDTLDIRQLAASDDEDAWPDAAAAFAGMMGIADANATNAELIDFQSPRKAAEKSTPKTTVALAGALAAIVLLGGGWMLYSRVASIEADAADYREQLEAAEQEIERLAPQQRQSEQVQAWLATDVNWLDELDRIAITLRPVPLDNHEEFKAERDVKLASIIATKEAGSRGKGGTATLAGGARAYELVNEIEERLRDERHQVESKGVVSDDANAPYVWNFQTDVQVEPVQEDVR